tara:strand:- start:318 stop:449 length:132 start_codon:yes stop_codon:yes gene_type:complete
MEYIPYGLIMGRKKKKAHILVPLELEHGHGGIKKEINGKKEPI